MFKNKKQVDVTEFELMKKRMDNLEKQLFELKKEKGITKIGKEGASIKVVFSPVGSIVGVLPKLRTDANTQVDFDGITIVDKSSVETKVDEEETLPETTIVTATKLIKIFRDSITIQTKDGIEVEKFKLLPQTDAEEQKKAFDEWYQKHLTKAVKELQRIANS